MTTKYPTDEELAVAVERILAAVRRSRYLAAISELADVLVDIPLADLPPYHRDLQAVIDQRKPAIRQALSAHAGEEFLDTILDLKGIDEQRFPLGRWRAAKAREYES
jgi:hypothetical protein